MTRLVAHFFGSFQITLDGKPVTAFESDKVRALLVFLAVESTIAHRRERLVGLLWPDRTEHAARTSLRGALADLRRAIGDRESQPPCLSSTRQTVQFDPAADAWIDVTLFEELLNADLLRSRPQALSRNACRLAIQRLEEAVGLYRGAFLEGFSVADAAPFEEWALLKREAYQRRAVEALDRLTECYAALGEHEAALGPARRQVELDPWNEKGHRNVMRVLALSGQRAAALAQYEACRALLAEGVEAEPARSTRELYQAIVAGTLPAPETTATDRPSRPGPGRTPGFLREQSAPAPAPQPLFVGRARQLERLFAWLKGVLSGRAQIAFVIGGPGRGKTALMHAFARQALDRHPHLVVASGHCNAYAGVGDPYLPFQMILGQLSGDAQARWAAGAIPRQHALRLWQTLPVTAQAVIDEGPDLLDTFVPAARVLERTLTYQAHNDTTAPWLAALQALVARKQALPPDPNLQQSALFRQYGRMLDAVASQRPLLLLIDDLQWTDLGSASLLLHLGRGLGASPVFILGAYRSEEVAAPPPAAYGGLETHPLQDVLSEMKRLFGDAWIDLSRTDAAEGRSFVDALLDSQPNRLDQSFRTTFHRHTQGHPLFSLELLRAMRDRGDLALDAAGRWIARPSLDWPALPPQVEGVIEQRVGRVGGELREILEIASVEGEDFTAQVIARVQGVDEREVQHKLSAELEARHRLVTSQGLSKLGEQPLSQHRFCHNLYQKYLYQSLSPAQRGYRHRDVGAALEGLYQDHPGALAAVAPQLARHYQAAGVTAKAIHYLHVAGERATRMSANQEAVAHFTRALELLATLPDGPQRDGQELSLQVGLIIPLQVLEGYGTPRLARALARARELCEQAGESPRLFPVLFSLAVFHSVTGAYQVAYEFGERLLNQAERVEDPMWVLIAHEVLGYPLILRGELVRGLVHMQHVSDVYDPEHHHPLAYLIGVDVGVACRVWTALALWLLGYPDQALKLGREALDLAQRLPHSASRAFAQGLTGCHFYHCYRDIQKCREWAEKCIAFCSQEGFPSYLALGMFTCGWTMAECGQPAEGIAQIREGITLGETTGSSVLIPLAHTMLAKSYGLAGMPGEGIAALARASAIVEKTGERYCAAEIHRTRGELLRMQGDEPHAEASFRQAIAVAQAQNARSWELRATMSLARLWQAQGKIEPARAMLAEIYGWFTEGFDSPDLQDARALLDELS